MNKFIAIVVLAAALTGCATTSTSSLPVVDVSSVQNGKALTPAEIDAAVRGKQMTGDITRANGSKMSNIVYVFESDGALKGFWPNGGDRGRWYVDQNTKELCTTWIRENPACGVVTVRAGKILLQNPRTGGQYLQQ